MSISGLRGQTATIAAPAEGRGHDRIGDRPAVKVALRCGVAASFAVFGFWASQLTDSAGGQTLPTLPGFSFPATTIGLTTPIATVSITTPSLTPAPTTTATATSSAPAPVAAAPTTTPAPDAKPTQAAAPPQTTTAAPAAGATPTTPTPRRAPRVAAAGANASSSDVSSPRALQQERRAAPRPQVQTSAPSESRAASPPVSAAAAPEPAIRPTPLGPASDVVRTPDPFPWPLAVAATAGGIGLLAAALGLLGIVPLALWAGSETCEIALWRSDGDGGFYAQAVGRRRKAEVVRSPLFRLHAEDPPVGDAAILAAHNVLVQRLAWDGWEPDEARNGVWWKQSFHRRTGHVREPEPRPA